MGVGESARGVGRPRGFSPEGKVAAATELFWANGFEATSLDMLTRRLGLSRSSFYACFGSKRALLMRALEAYAAAMLARLRAAPGAAAVVAMLAETDDPAHGCLLVNCIAELAPHDPELAGFARDHLDAIAAVLAGHLDGDDRAARADALTALAVGALTLRKAGAPAERVAALLAAATALIDG